MLRLALCASLLLLGCAAPVAPVAAAAPVAPEGPRESRALALGYGGFVDTDVPLAALIAQDHTLMAWIMPASPYAYAGPILAENGAGAWSLGQGDYRWGKGGFKKAGPPVLYLRVGSAQIVASPPRPLRPREWRHVAVVRRGDLCTLYVDGARIADLPVGGAALPVGTLRIGRRTTGQPALPEAYEGQFYGLVDDVVVLSHALTDDELLAAAKPGAHPTGAERDLVAAFTFDEGGEARSSEGGRAAGPLARPLRAGPRAVSRVAASRDRDSAEDAARIPLPDLAVPMHLPFDAGAPWRVVQGNDAQGGSHNGYAAFSWDFVLAGQPLSRTRGRTARAAAPGRVVLRVEGGGDNHVMLRHAPEQFSAYMHLLPGSIAAALGAATGTATGTGRDDGPEVRGDQPIGLVGDTGAGSGNYHLHVSVSNRGDHGRFMVTLPAAFSDYDASDDAGRTWRHVALGVPTVGQWVRRAP